MCISDLRIGRLTAVNRQAFDLGSGVGVTFLPNRQRTHLLIVPDIVMSVTQGFRVTFTNGTTVAIWGSAGPLDWSLGSHGSQLQFGGTLSVLSGNLTGSIIEHTVPESVLADEINRYESELARMGGRGY